MALTPRQRERYARQLVLPQLGPQGQARLAASRVLIVGVGGLGAMVAQALAGAGLGYLRIIDPDVVEISNLQRQWLYRESQLGQPKVLAAAEQLLGINSSIEVNSIKNRFDIDNAEKIIEGMHLVIDGSDNYATRYLINQHCIRAGIPWVYGAAEALEGQVSSFWPGRGTACYACLYPPSTQADDRGCAQRGVLGMLPALVAQIQALEAIKLLADWGEPLLNQLLSIDALHNQFHRSRFRAEPDCCCASAAITPVQLPPR